jgi:hypothetical protein
MAKRIAKKPAKRLYQVFISHATTDKWIARVICEKIEALGIKTFRDDRDITGGDDIPDSLRREIRRSKEVLVLLTPKSVSRPWVLVEVGAAWGMGKRRRIVPILYHVDPTEIPTIIQLVRAFPLNDFEQYLDELEARVKRTRS